MTWLYFLRFRDFHPQKLLVECLWNWHLGTNNCLLDSLIAILNTILMLSFRQMVEFLSASKDCLHCSSKNICNYIKWIKISKNCTNLINPQLRPYCFFFWTACKLTKITNIPINAIDRSKMMKSEITPNKSCNFGTSVILKLYSFMFVFRKLSEKKRKWPFTNR